MAFKFVVFAAALACANAGLLPAAAPVAYSAAPAVAYSAAPAVSHVSYSSPVVSYGAPVAAPAITSQHSNILRSFGNLGQVSTYSKTIDTPFSSVSKSDVRVSNPGLRIAAAPVAHAYAAPVAHAAYAAPVATAAYAAPVAHAAYAAPVAHAAYAAPVAKAIGVAYSAAPAVSHVTYTGLGASYGW
ncbi:pupal cuticle protein C1B [Zophobas morio]|uniref:pupal cuticle protein C1B n=1 Tax=Zophobas morio TaxID=2755281 RepID=UPI0030834A86